MRSRPSHLFIFSLNSLCNKSKIYKKNRKLTFGRTLKEKKITWANHTVKAQPLRSMETNTKDSGNTESLKATESYQIVQKTSSTRVSSIMEKQVVMELRPGL